MRLPGALLLALVLSGCGGDAATTRQDWVRAADAVCARYGPRIAALGPMPTGNAAIAAHLRANLALTRPELDQVTALPRPGGADGDAIAATIASRRAALAALTEAAAVAGAGRDPAALLARARTLVQAARAAATALGMTVCGGAPPPSSDTPS